MDGFLNQSTNSALLALQTTADPRWPMVVARDPNADGTFLYLVKTTGVYCRPSCAARPARPENVQFHTTCQDAAKAGFRPCKRCKPDQVSPVEQHAGRIAAACRMIEISETQPTLNRLAQHAGLSPYHFHRIFKAATGLTPKGYAVAHRNNLVRKALKKRSTVTQAIYDAGYNSNGPFYKNSNQVLGMAPSIYRTGGARTEIDSPLANVLWAPSSLRKATLVSAPFSSEMLRMR